HYGLVGPFEIERIDDRLAYPGVLELVAAGIEEPALAARRQFIRQGLALDPAVLDRRKIVACSPDPRGELFPVEIVLAGKAFEGHVAVAIELVAHGVEIVAAAVDGKIGRPIILDAVKLDVAIDLVFADLVRPRAERDFGGRFLERALRIIGL